MAQFAAWSFYIGLGVLAYTLLVKTKDDDDTRD